MKQSTSLLTLAFACTFSVFPSLQAQERANFYFVEALFDLAELHFPDLFSSRESTVTLHVSDARETVGWEWSWFYRYYPGSDTYLAVKEYGNSVYVFSPSFGSEVTRVGWLDELLRLFPSGLIKPGTEECIEVGSPQPGTTAYYGGSRWDQVVSWQTSSNGSIEVLRHGGSFFNQRHDFTERESITSHAGLSYLDSSSMAYLRPRPFSDSGWNQETENTQYTPGMLLGPSRRYCVGQGWFSAPVTRSSTYTYFPASSAGPIPSLLGETETSMTVNYVVSVNQPVRAQAGEFVTVEIVTNGQRRWIDIETGIVVKGVEFLNDPDNWDWDWGVAKWSELYALDFSGQCPIMICHGN